MHFDHQVEVEGVLEHSAEVWSESEVDFEKVSSGFVQHQVGYCGGSRR